MATRIEPIRIETDQLCEYGCGQKAKYIVTVGGKKCCSNKWESCLELIRAKKKNLKGISKKSSTVKYKGDHLCDYGCGNIAKYILKNGKLCCHNDSRLCSELIRKSAKTRTGANRTEEMKNRISEAHIGQISEKKGKIYLEIYGEEKSKEIKEKMSKTKKFTLKDYQEKYPFFCKIEELRENPETGEIQGRCKNHNCPNSKEQNGWFILSRNQIHERVRCLESKKGNDGCYFYCSEKCKRSCSLFGKSAEQFIREDQIRTGIFKEKEKLYTDAEYQTFRQEVLKRDNYECIYCGEKATDIHHTRPQKLESFFALDPDYAISCCEKCHYKYGHKKGTECSTWALANKDC